MRNPVLFSLGLSKRAAALAVGAAVATTAAAALAAPAAAAPRTSWLTAQHVPLRAMMPDSMTSQSAAVPAGGYRALARPYLAYSMPMHANTLVGVQLADRGGVPVSAAAAVLEITASGVTSPGEISVFTGRRGGTATLQYAPGARSTSTAVVPLVHGGRFKIMSIARHGRTSAYITVNAIGYYESTTSADGGSYHPVQQTRVVAPTSVAGGRSLRPLLAGRAGVPRGAGAVAVSVTATRVGADGAVLAGDAGSTPTAAIAHTSRGRAVTAFAVLPLSGGRVSLRNRSTAPMSLAVDVLGYYDAGAPDLRDMLGTLPPTPVAARPIGAHGTLQIQVGGRAGVPKARVSAVLATVHAVNPAAAGRLRAANSAPAVSFAAHRPSANTVLLPVSHGHVSIRNDSGGRVTVQLDVRGYVPGNPVPAPLGTATARYLNALVDQNTQNYRTLNAATMKQYGCDDAKGGVTFTLLDVGVQSITAPQLSPSSPGVLLALTQQTRLTYPDLRAAIEAYFDGYEGCNTGGSPLRVAVGTNNDGVYSGQFHYYARNRGADWADHVVNPLNSAAAAKGYAVTVVGADDIEAQFDHSEAHAQAWEDAYLARTSSPLIYNGDANDCPTTYGATGRSCAFWTEQQYYTLAHRKSRIQVLPQLFFPGEAVKWANIDATGDASGADGLIFAGALTENARVPSELSPAQGRAALYRALSSVVVDPGVPLAVDLQAGAP